MYLYVKYHYMLTIADLPKWLSQRQASMFAMQTAKQVQRLLWQRWWCTLCRRLLYLHLQTCKFLSGREWSSNAEPQENRSRRWNGQNIELALLSSNYHILSYLIISHFIFISVGLHTGFWTCWCVPKVWLIYWFYIIHYIVWAVTHIWLHIRTSSFALSCIIFSF